MPVSDKMEAARAARSSAGGLARAAKIREQKVAALAAADKAATAAYAAYEANPTGENMMVYTARTTERNEIARKLARADAARARREAKK
jgi:hypothetical protein